MRGRTVALVVLALAAPTAWPGSAAAAGPTCDGRRATIVGTSQGEVLTGTAGDDVIAALGGSDRVDGRRGNDRICGGAGADLVTGGPGDDRLFGGRDRLLRTEEGTERIGDALRGGAGDDRMVPGRDRRTADDVTPDLVAWDGSPRGVRVDLSSGRATGHGHDRFAARGIWVLGSDHADVIEGSRFADRVAGGPGADLVRTRGGNDRVVGGPGPDVVHGGSGGDELSADSGRDRLHGGPGADTLDNSAGTPVPVRLFAGSGNDLVVASLPAGSAEQMVVRGGTGTGDRVTVHTHAVNPDALPGAGSWDMSTGALVLDVGQPVRASVRGFEDADLAGYGATWSVRGTDGADRLVAVGTAATTFEAGGGSDSFWGSPGDDLFDGGDGTDRSLGTGAGSDTCISVEDFDVADCETVTP